MTRESFLYGQTWTPRPPAVPVSEPEPKAEEYDRAGYAMAEADEGRQE